MENINIAIAEDQKLFRQSLAALIAGVPTFRLTAETDNGNDFLDKLKIAATMPDIALIDMDMPGMNGIQLNLMLHKHYPGIRVIILSVHTQQRLIFKMIEAGACAYLAKNCDKDELILAINTVHTTGFYMNSDALKAIRDASAHKGIKNMTALDDELTTREKEILQLVCRQYSNAEIAAELFLSVRTVEGHRNNLLLKTGCRNTAGLVLYAIRHGIFDIYF